MTVVKWLHPLTKNLYSKCVIHSGDGQYPYRHALWVWKEKKPTDRETQWTDNIILSWNKAQREFKYLNKYAGIPHLQEPSIF